MHAVLYFTSYNNYVYCLYSSHTHLVATRYILLKAVVATNQDIASYVHVYLYLTIDWYATSNTMKMV